MNNNLGFYEWNEGNSILVKFVTLFSTGNVEILHLLDSKYAGFKIFDAPFSPRALYLISLGGILNIFVEDLPQLLIQVNYVKLFFF